MHLSGDYADRYTLTDVMRALAMSEPPLTPAELARAKSDLLSWFTVRSADGTVEVWRIGTDAYRGRLPALPL